MPKPYQPNDRLSRRAQFQGYRARSVFKLREIDEKFHLLKEGQSVLDVGAYPGSWLQYIALKIGLKGHVIGVDLQPIEPVAPNVTTIEEDILNIDQLSEEFRELNIREFDLVVSDIAPNTTGISGVDHARSIEMSQMVVDLAEEFLRPKGTLVMKVFHGEKFAAFFKSLQRQYGFVTGVKVSASRDRSKEMYIVCQRKK